MIAQLEIDGGELQGLALRTQIAPFQRAVLDGQPLLILQPLFERIPVRNIPVILLRHLRQPHHADTAVRAPHHHQVQSAHRQLPRLELPAAQRFPQIDIDACRRTLQHRLLACGIQNRDIAQVNAGPQTVPARRQGTDLYRLTQDIPNPCGHFIVVFSHFGEQQTCDAEQQGDTNDQHRQAQPQSGKKKA